MATVHVAKGLCRGGRSRAPEMAALAQQCQAEARLLTKSIPVYLDQALGSKKVVEGVVEVHRTESADRAECLKRI